MNVFFILRQQNHFEKLNHFDCCIYWRYQFLNFYFWSQLILNIYHRIAYIRYRSAVVVPKQQTVHNALNIDWVKNYTRNYSQHKKEQSLKCSHYRIFNKKKWFLSQYIIDCWIFIYLSQYKDFMQYYQNSFTFFSQVYNFEKEQLNHKNDFQSN